jgi:hypothetical protein
MALSDVVGNLYWLSLAGVLLMAYWLTSLFHWRVEVHGYWRLTTVETPPWHPAT